VGSVAAIDSVRLEGVSKLYGRQRALSGVTLEMTRGRLTVVLGPNGAGKSTLVGVLSTLVRPTAGRIIMGGLQEPRAIRAAIGLLAHDALVYPELTAVENLHFWGRLYDVPDLERRAAALLDEVGLDAQARARAARTYSRGMLQRLSLARALLPSPTLLLLDEPFTGLDRSGQAALGRALARAKAEDRIVVVVSHDLEAIGDLAEHLVILRAGKVVLDETREQPFSAAELRARAQAALD
jgi:heme exporter protein A